MYLKMHATYMTLGHQFVRQNMNEANLKNVADYWDTPTEIPGKLLNTKFISTCYWLQYNYSAIALRIRSYISTHSERDQRTPFSNINSGHYPAKWRALFQCKKPHTYKQSSNHTLHTISMYISHILEHLITFRAPQNTVTNSWIQN